jgi:hypothetical protein
LPKSRFTSAAAPTPSAGEHSKRDHKSGSRWAHRKLIADETEKWGKVIRAAGIKAD